MSNDYSRDPDDLYGDTKVAVLEIAVRKNGSMSVAGCINDLAYALKMCDEAKDAIRRHHARQVNIIIPPNATDLKVPG
jgi:hypothetical protein